MQATSQAPQPGHFGIDDGVLVYVAPDRASDNKREWFLQIWHSRSSISTHVHVDLACPAALPFLVERQAGDGPLADLHATVAVLRQ